MSHIGLCPFLGRGHLNPLGALGRGLIRAGHSVTAFHLMTAKSAVLRAGLRHISTDKLPASFEPDTNDGPRGCASWKATEGVVRRQIGRMLTEGLDSIASARVDALIVDHMDVAAGSVAEHLGIPFLTISISPPIGLNDEVPPAYFGLPEASSGLNRRAHIPRCNRVLRRVMAPSLCALNEWRVSKGLEPLVDINQVLSPVGIIAQMPKCFDLPRNNPPANLYYTGPFRDAWTDPAMSFPWERLTGAPVIFASLGTVRNNNISLFQTVAEAAAIPGYQLVIALGGGKVRPADLKIFAPNTIIADYVPQRELLRVAALTINCAGLNTTFDSIAARVPIVAIPIAEDQPGVAVRIRRAGIGDLIPAKLLTVDLLRRLILKVLGDPVYRTRVGELGCEINAIDGIGMCIEVIENALDL